MVLATEPRVWETPPRARNAAAAKVVENADDTALTIP
jgi:hypothetical protein